MDKKSIAKINLIILIIFLVSQFLFAKLYEEPYPAFILPDFHCLRKNSKDPLYLYSYQVICEKSTISSSIIDTLSVKDLATKLRISPIKLSNQLTNIFLGFNDNKLTSSIHDEMGYNKVTFNRIEHVFIGNKRIPSKLTLLDSICIDAEY